MNGKPCWRTPSQLQHSTTCMTYLFYAFDNLKELCVIDVVHVDTFQVQSLFGWKGNVGVGNGSTSNDSTYP